MDDWSNVLGNIKINFPKVKIFLKENKIYFETITSVALTIASLFVGVLQLVQTWKYTNLTNLQTSLAEAQAMPAFNIHIVQKYNEEVKYYDENVLSIENTGGLVSSFSSRIAYYIDVETVSRLSQKKISLRIPISDYYRTSIVGHEGKGNLETAFGYHNNTAFGNLSRAVIAARDDKIWSASLISGRTYLQISYDDLLDRHHTEYYEAFTTGRQKRISNELGISIFSDWTAGGANMMTIDKLTAQDIYDRLNKSFSSQQNEK